MNRPSPIACGEAHRPVGRHERLEAADAEAHLHVFDPAHVAYGHYTYLLNLMKGPQMAHILRSENAIATGDYLGGRSSQANVIST